MKTSGMKTDRRARAEIKGSVGMPFLLLSLVLAGSCSESRSPLAPSLRLQQPGQPTTHDSVVGTVVDSFTQRAVPYARVEWTLDPREAWDDRDLHVLTDQGGHYGIAAQPNQALSIRVVKEGYLSPVKQVVVGTETVFLPFEIDPVGPPGTARGRGTVSWVSISSPGRTLCSEITRQVGQTYPLWLTMATAEADVTLELSHEPPSPLGDPPSVFKGQLAGSDISARSTGTFGGLSCPTDTTITPQTGGALTAKLTDGSIGGEYTEVYGTGDSQIVFLFHFEAGLPRP